jgi:uncharacterized protein YkwD
VAHPQRLLRLAAALALAAQTVGARAYDPNKLSPGVVAGGSFKPALPASAQLGPDQAYKCGRSSILSDLERKLADLAKQKKAPLAAQDGQLCALADTFTGWKEEGAVPADLAAAVAQHLGIPFRPQVSLATFETAAPEDVVPALVETVGNFMLNAKSPRFGLVVERIRSGTARERKERARVAVALLDAPVAFQPFPRRLEPGASAAVAGEVLGDYSGVKVLTSDELGKLATPEQPPGKAFKAEVTCGDRPGGRVTLEIHGEAAAGSRALATVAIQCGGELPSSFPLATAAWPKDPAAAEEKMGEAINADRAVVGLPALEYDPALAAVARSVAEKLRDAIAQGLPPTVDTGVLLKDAGLASPVLLQNPGEAASAEEAQARFSLSPSMRQNILSTEVNHLGVGVTPAKDAAGRETVLVAQLFTKVLPVIDPAQARADLYAAVQQKRAEAKSPAATVDPAIEKIAQKYAEAMARAGGKLSDDEADEITHPLRAPFKSINMIEGAKGSVGDFLKDSTVTWDGTAMGAGVAQGNHPVLGKNALYVVFVVATPRPADKAAAKPAAPAPKPKPKKK